MKESEECTPQMHETIRRQAVTLLPRSRSEMSAPYLTCMAIGWDDLCQSRKLPDLDQLTSSCADGTPGSPSNSGVATFATISEIVYME